MIICNHCGAPVPDGATFCGECGTPNVTAAPPVHYPPPPPPPDPRFRPGPDYPPKKSGAGLIVGVILGLIVLGGVALYAMVASTTRGTSNNNNSSGNYNSTSNSSSGTNYNRNANTRPTSSPSGTSYNTNTGSASPFQRAEDKIRSQEYLSVAELSSLNCWDLKLLRNTFFAKYGRIFDEPELQAYFDGKSWYSRDYNYYSNTQDPGITSIDKANIETVKAAEDRQSCRRGK
ncbi:MAG TPA: YARHG domain-containing protein [Pyrinomonadaceae bacterium]|nr:YARHG domain-containing protein [Pyrinomonadaceae bacterium]